MKKILVIRNDHIGDLCLTIPFFYAIKQVFRNCRLDVLVNDYIIDLVRENPVIDNLYITEQEIIEKYDVIFNLVSKKENYLLMYRLKSKLKVAYGYKIYSILINVPLYIHRKNPPLHETEFCFKFLSIFGKKINKKMCIENSKIFIAKKIKDKVNNYINKNFNLVDTKQNILVHSGDNKSAFNWSVKKYIELMLQLKKDYNVIYILGPNELEILNQLDNDFKQKINIVKGNLSIIELSYLISLGDLFISGSTGPMHIAGLMGTKTLSLFSNKPSHSYKKWHPIKNDYYIIEPEISYSKQNCTKLMDSIKVDKVINSIKSILN